MILDLFSDIIQNRMFLSAFWAWFVAQFIKGSIGLIVNIRLIRKARKELSIEEKEEVSMVKDMMSSLLWKTGGMPSSHTSMSSALTLSVGLEEGFMSSLFIVCFFFTGIVVRDSTGVRLLAGKLAKKVNVLVDDYNHKARQQGLRRLTKLKVVEGHTFSEVFVGIVLGAFVCIVVYLILGWDQ